MSSHERIDGPESAWREAAGSLEVVECELNTECNRACVYCPQSKGLLPSAPRFLPDALLEYLLEDLARIDFRGRFSHHLYGEPLLNPDLPRTVRRIRDALPRAVQVLFTNGDLLTDEVHRALLEAGIALFAVTRHERGEYPARPRQAVQYARELEFTSRGGSIEFLLKKKRASLARIQSQPCLAPHEMLIVGWDGHILRCYEDARRDEPLGNLYTHTLGGIWHAARPIRAALACGQRAAAGRPCGGCDNVNHTTPGQSLATEPFWETHPDAAAVAKAHFRARNAAEPR